MKRVILVCLLFIMMITSSCRNAIPEVYNTAEPPEETIVPTTTTSSVNEEFISLCMPKKIVLEACFSGILDLTITPAGEKSILFRSDYKGDITVELTNKDIQTLNTLYASITDFSNLPMIDDIGNYDVTLIDNGETHTFCSILTTQVELEQYLKLLQSYYTGVEYDWSVEPIDENTPRTRG